MMNEWQRRWGIPDEAMEEMRLILTRLATPEAVNASTPENIVQAEIRMEAASKGCVLWRNNVGLASDDRGNLIRFGLANDSKKMNHNIKSSDLIGIRKLVVTPEMVGTTVGQFIAREVKRGNWKYSGTQREQAQLKFLELVMSYGGDAGFANSRGSL